MKSREISQSKIGPFSLACTDPYIGIGWECQSSLPSSVTRLSIVSSVSFSFFFFFFYPFMVSKRHLTVIFWSGQHSESWHADRSLCVHEMENLDL